MSAEWKVLVVTTEKLEFTLNWFEEHEYKINKYEPLIESFEGPTWIVVGYKENIDEKIETAPDEIDGVWKDMTYSDVKDFEIL
jgi:hypothetical protein